MNALERLYPRLPIPLQNASCSLEGWRIQRTRFARRFDDLLREAVARSFWRADEIQTYRDNNLREFLIYCASCVPYYRRKFREVDVDPQTIRGLDDLKRLPLLTKDEVRNHYKEFQPETPLRERTITAHTSGTTGSGLRFATTLKAVQQQWAVWWRYRNWHGIKRETWCGYFGGRSVVPLTQTGPPFWRYDYPGRRILFSAYHMSLSNIDSYLEQLRRSKPLWLHGYPSLLALLAARILELSFDLNYELRWITTGAENLLPQQRAVIKKAFNVEPRQSYGLAESVANLSECELGCLHVDEDFAAVEFVSEKESSNWKIVGTNFTNPATPLVRYDTGDRATFEGHACSCGRPGRVVASLDGRQEDYIILKNGARLGRMDHIFKDMVNIREAQIRQRRIGEVNVLIVKGSQYLEADEALLRKEMCLRVGSDTAISIEYVDKIKRSSTGKIRFVLSDLETGKLSTGQTENGIVSAGQ